MCHLGALLANDFSCPWGADAITQGVPVSVLDDEYTKATINLGSTIQQYAAIDLYNPDRAKVRAWLRVKCFVASCCTNSHAQG